MTQEEIHKFIDTFNYFTAILVLCFNSPTSSLQSVSILAQTPPPHTQKKRTDVILKRSLTKLTFYGYISDIYHTLGQERLRLRWW